MKMKEINTREVTDRHFVLHPISPGALRNEYADNLMSLLPSHVTELFTVDGPDGVKSFVGLSIDDKKSLFGRVVDATGPRAEAFIGETTFGYFGTEYPPRVLSDTTNPEFRERGFAKRRAAIINQICKERFGIALRSSTVNSELEHRVWRRLVEHNLAKVETDPHGKKVYSFL